MPVHKMIFVSLSASFLNSTEFGLKNCVVVREFINIFECGILFINPLSA